MVGGGWTGCHLATRLLSLGFHVKLLEERKRIFQSASGFNQSRLHVGYHYPRSFETIANLKLGTSEFLMHYDFLTKNVSRNFYGIAVVDSLLEWNAYLALLELNGLTYEVFSPSSLDLRNLSGLVRVDERVINVESARTFFSDNLTSHLMVGTPVREVVKDGRGVRVNGEYHDLLLDCTSGRLGCIPSSDQIYEPTLLFYFKSSKPNAFSLTVMDGRFFSLLEAPHLGPDMYCLSSVTHSPLGRYRDYSDASERIQSIKLTEVYTRLSNAIKGFSHFVPDFENLFEWISFSATIKVKHAGNASARKWEVLGGDPVMSIVVEKIGYITLVEKIVLERMVGKKLDRRLIENSCLVPNPLH